MVPNTRNVFGNPEWRVVRRAVRELYRLVAVFEQVQQLPKNPRNIPAIDLIDEDHEVRIRLIRCSAAELLEYAALEVVAQGAGRTIGHWANPLHEVLVPI